MKLAFLAHDEQGNMRLINRTVESEAPNVEEEWDSAVALWKDKVPLLGGLTLVGALTVTPDARVRWYPDRGEDPSTEAVGRTLH